MECITDENDNPNYYLYQCKLGDKYISPCARIFQHPDFEAGVIKIQQGIDEELSDDEKMSIIVLLKCSENTEHVHKTGAPKPQSISERLEKRRNIGAYLKYYINCDFILISVVEVE